MAAEPTSAEETQIAVRNANGRFRDVALAKAWNGGMLLPFICECADADCLGRIEMTAADYEATHLDRHAYVIIRDHPAIEGERLVEDRDSFLVMTKADIHAA
jgi:hypothetical protein